MEPKRLKIVFLARYVGSVNRGAETYVLELSKRLNSNHQIDVFTGSDADSLPRLLKGNFDLVIPTNGRIQALKAGLGRNFKNYKTLISGQAGIGRDDKWNIAITCPDVFVALTDAQLIMAKNWAWRTKVVKIPNGVDLEKFNPKGEKINIDLPRPIILSVGALAWYKHHERTIHSLSTLKEGSLLIIGSGTERQNLEALIKDKNLDSRVKIIQVDYQDIPKYYRSADIFTLPSWDREAFGIVYLEAMASGLPVIAPDDLSRKEIVGEAGILVDVQNNDVYAKAMKEALNKNWKDLPLKQAEKFSWNNIVSQYENLFQEMFK